MRILFVSAILVFADQITKGMVRSTMSLYESIPVITDFFHITYVTNDGMAFGLNFPLVFMFFQVYPFFLPVSYFGIYGPSKIMV